MAAVAQAEGKIAETSLQIIQIDEDLRAEVMKELREIQAKVAELVERKVAAEDQLKRIDIRAPSDGYVHQLAVHTVGGVISPAEPAMLIVPRTTRLDLEAKVMPNDIDQLALGQSAIVRVHASNARTTPELIGTVTRISRTSPKDQQTGLSYYTIRVALPAEELRRLGELQLVAGMQAEVFVQTHDRTQPALRTRDRPHVAGDQIEPRCLPNGTSGPARAIPGWPALLDGIAGRECASTNRPINLAAQVRARPSWIADGGGAGAWPWGRCPLETR